MNENILVVGGTGLLGKPIVRKFASNGHNVCVMSTNPESYKNVFDSSVELVYGDVTRPDSLVDAVADKDWVYLNLSAKHQPDLYQSIEIEGAANVARAAVNAGVKRIGMISAASARGEEIGEIFCDAKVKAERALIDSGIDYLLFRPTWFFESLPMFVQSGRAGVIGKQPLPISWLAAVDYADQVYNGYSRENTVNKAYYILGPQKLTMMEAVKIFCEEVHPDITPQEISFTQAKMLSMLPGMEKLKRAIPFFEYFSKRDENIDPSEANELLGKNETDINQWIKQYRQSLE